MPSINVTQAFAVYIDGARRVFTRGLHEVSDAELDEINGSPAAGFVAVQGTARKKRTEAVDATVESSDEEVEDTKPTKRRTRKRRSSVED